MKRRTAPPGSLYALGYDQGRQFALDQATRDREFALGWSQGYEDEWDRLFPRSNEEDEEAEHE